jgi:predicted nucleic acid-binding protein
VGQKYLIDTNTLIDFQTNTLPQKGSDYVTNVIDNDFIVSFVNYIEFLGYPGVSKQMEDLIALAEVIEINKSIINHTIFLRKKNKIKLPDAIIAATAISQNLTLITHNTKDFMKIEGLKVIDPYNL